MSGMTKSGHSLLYTIILTHLALFIGIYFFPDEKVAAIMNGARASVAAAIIAMYVFPAIDMFKLRESTRASLLATGIVLAASSQLIAGIYSIMVQVYGAAWLSPTVVSWFSLLSVIGGTCHIIAPSHDKSAPIDVWYPAGMWVGIGVAAVIGLLLLGYFW